MKTISSFRSKLFALTLALMASVASFAYEFEYVNDFHIDGFAYSINSTSANNDSEEGYVGLIEIADCQKDVLVPKYVSYGDRGFHVTKFGMGSVVFTNEAGSVVESVTIPNTTYVINKNVLAGCPNLKTVVVDSENPYYDSRENCNAIITTSQNPYFTPNTLIAGCKTTIIPNSVVEIGANAFYNCQSLETITIPNSVTKIGRSAFNACSALSSITLSENLTAIGDWAFDDCNNLIEVVCYATQPPTISQYTFSGISPTIYVPAESIEQYRAADGWKDLQIQYISWSEGCEEYKHINLAVQMLPKISSMIFDISNNGTIEPPYVDSVWILKTEQEPLRKLDAQSGDTIDLSFLEENEDYILRVYINGCIKSRTFWHRVIPNNWPDTWCDTWNVMWFDGWFFDETASTSKYRLGKDTIIGDYTYSKFTSRTSVRFTEDWKVYVYYEGFDDNDPYTQDLPTGEYLAYDFSAQVGDTLEVFSGVHSYSKYKCLVREVQTDPETKLRTITLFQLLLEDTDGDGVEEEYGRGEMTWIEGVGSPNGFLINTPPTGGGTFALLCAYKDDELKYTGDLYDEYGCEYNATEQNPEDLFPTLWGLQRTEVEYHTDGADAPSLVSFEEYTPTFVNGKWYLYDGMNYLREENNQVLLYSPHFEIYKDIVLYDWTLEVGDTLPYYFDKSAYKGAYYVVTNVSTITLLDGKEYKKWTLACGIEYIEGIGAINGEGYGHYLCLQHWDHPATYIGNRLVCASRNGQLLYQMDDAEMERLGAECLCDVETSYKSQWCDTWNVMWFDGMRFDETASTSQYRLGKDTIIGDYTYRKFTSRTSVRFTNDRKVYVYYEGYDDNDPYTVDLPTGEYLAYDFSAQVGDTLEVFSGIGTYSTYPCVVYDVETAPSPCVVDDVQADLKTFPLIIKLHPLCDVDGEGNMEISSEEITWIEGIGSPEGFLISSLPCGWVGGGLCTLLCAYKDNELKYTGSFYERFGCEYNAGVVSDDLFPTLSGLQRTICNEYCEDSKTSLQKFEDILFEHDKPYIYCESAFLIREENNKILIYSHSLDKDLVLYDFTLEVGDSLPRLYLDESAEKDLYWIDYSIMNVVDYHKDSEGNILPADTLIVTDVSTITLLDGKEYKKWTFNNGMEYVEGIGSFGNNMRFSDFFQLIGNMAVPVSLHGTHLVCVSKNNKLLYQMDDAEMERLGAECLCDYDSGHRKDNAKDGQIGGRPTPTQWNQLEVVLRQMDNNHTILQAETFSYTLE
ncbi:MAG: leucine-rich repeat domain-containing protein, partial [Paludibacteraceae bacterium]|nr:leucine-rich repeat domain-containing protein [Paludibacteraceae bacterium]